MMMHIDLVERVLKWCDVGSIEDLDMLYEWLLEQRSGGERETKVLYKGML